HHPVLAKVDAARHFLIARPPLLAVMRGGEFAFLKMAPNLDSCVLIGGGIRGSQKFLDSLNGTRVSISYRIVSRRGGVKGILKWPLIIAAVVVVFRVVVEQAGAPDGVANLLSVVALHFVICPVYFAIRIAKGGIPRPYITEFKLITLYVLLVRAMVLPIYWLARVYGWPQQRFHGLAGPDVSAFRGYIGIPFVTAGFWIVASVVFGGVLGSIIIAITNRAVRPVATSDRVPAHRE